MIYIQKLTLTGNTQVRCFIYLFGKETILRTLKFVNLDRPGLSNLYMLLMSLIALSSYFKYTLNTGCKFTRNLYKNNRVSTL